MACFPSAGAVERLDEQYAKRVHLVGVAGTGLRGLAAILAQRGILVSGSEAEKNPSLDDLRALGVTCHVGHAAENLAPDTGLVVISAAIEAKNPEVEEAVARDLPVIKYAECVGLLLRERTGIAVAGTHGKTTTTALTAQVLQETGRDPGFIIGGDYPVLGGSARWGEGKHFLAEACEFDRSFLNFYPDFAIVTNIDADHLDYFSSLEDIQEAFAEFVGHIPADGLVVLNADDRRSATLADSASCRPSRFSLRPEGGDWWAENIRPTAGGIAFRAVSRSGESTVLRLRVPGVHNVKNSLAVLTLLREMGLPLEEIAPSLENFCGVKRRFEVLLREPGVVIDDYAHHPTEIEMVLRAARETFAGRRLRVVFQPHQYSRTYRLFDEFARSLAAADEVLVTDVFASRDTAEDISRIDSPALVNAVVRRGGRAGYCSGFDEVIEEVRETFHFGEVLLCLGAGSITQLASRLAETLANPVEEVA